MKTYRTLRHRNIASSDWQSPTRSYLAQLGTLVCTVDRREKSLNRESFCCRNRKEQNRAEAEERDESTHLGLWEPVCFFLVGRSMSNSDFVEFFFLNLGRRFFVLVFIGLVGELLE